MDFSEVGTDRLGEVAESALTKFGKGIYLLFGEMGAGKTTLVKAFCQQLKVSDQPSSPTYSIINQYRTASGESVFHMDLYRLESDREVADLGIDEILENADYVFVEWPEKILNFLPDSCVRVDVLQGGEQTRSFKFSLHDQF
jgi:tRNA threonylcarbamoyladenosine biosynthesis protein TsaE